MSYARRLTVAVTTDGSGGATAFSDPIAYGVLDRIQYVKTDFANGVDFTITDEATGETLWSELNVDAAATRAPRQATHSTAGAAALYAAAGQAVLDRIPLVATRVKIVVASGGANKTGAFNITLV